MNAKEEIDSLIAYLQALVEVQKCGEIRVFAEMRRTIAKL